MTRRRLLPLGLLLLLLTSLPLLGLASEVVAGDDESEAGAPRTVETVAEEVLEAVAAGDEKALKALAAAEPSAPWLVADLLCAEEAYDAAEAFAKAAPSKDVEALPAYIRAQRERLDDTEARAAWAAVLAAYAQRDVRAASAVLERTKAREDTVIGILLAVARRDALIRNGRIDDAEAATRKATESALKLGWLSHAAKIHFDLGAFCFMSGSPLRARRAYERALEVEEMRDDPYALAMTVHNLGNALAEMGKLEMAEACFRRALPIQEAIGDREGVAGTLIDLAGLQRRRLRYGPALLGYERGIAKAREAGQRTWEANAHEGMGAVLSNCGFHEEALANFERSLEIRTVLDRARQVASALQNIGEEHHALGNDTMASDALKRAAGLWRRVGDTAWLIRTYDLLAEVRVAQGRPAKALPYRKEALALAGETSDTDRISALCQLGELKLEIGRVAEGFADIEDAVEQARQLGQPRYLAENLSALAAGRLEVGEYATARQLADEVRTLCRSPLRELPGTFTPRKPRPDPPPPSDTGALAASRVGDASGLFRFLEWGRAGGPCERQWKREPFQDAPFLNESRQNETEARARLREAVRRKGMPARDRRIARLDLLTAVALTDALLDAMPTDLGPCARPADLEDIRASLPPGHALVLYGLPGDEVLAAVLTAEDLRLVKLGGVAAIRAAHAALHDPTAKSNLQLPLALLRRHLVEKLGLGDEIQQVLVSPVGILQDVPFGALFDRPVARVSSGTSIAVRALPARTLPRGEGTRVVGRELSVPGLLEALAGGPRLAMLRFDVPRVLDPEHPLLSALEFAPSDDAWLAFDIETAKVPADLVILAGPSSPPGLAGAAETGLACAFLAAGATQVLAPLWSGDEDATRVLMEAFRGAWRSGEDGGPNAAEALQAAQAAVRGDPTHPRWKLPYYWAGWAIWGAE